MFYVYGTLRYVLVENSENIKILKPKTYFTYDQQ
jgi:hypothetical protein